MSLTKFGKKILGLIAMFLLAFVIVGCVETSDAKKEAQKNLDEIYASITWDDDALNERTSNLTLVTNTKFPGVTVSWASTRPDVIATDGKLTRPEFDDEAAEVIGGNKVVKVTITATITSKYTEDGTEKQEVKTKSFDFTVLCMPEVTGPTNLTQVKADAINAIKGGAASYNGVVYGKVVAKFTDGGQIFIHDGTTGIFVFASYDGEIGDVVKVVGTFSMYYDIVQIGSDITVTKVTNEDEIANAGLTDPSFVEQTVSALNKNPKDANMGGQAYNLYAKLVVDPSNSNSFCLEDPYDGTLASLYYKSYNTDAEKVSILQSFVGKYVNIKVVQYDRHSTSLQDRFAWTGAEIIEANAPELSDEDKALLYLSELEMPARVTEDFVLDANCVWTVVSGNAIEVTELQAETGLVCTAKVTRPAHELGNDTVVLKAEYTFNNAKASKEFTVVVVKAAYVGELPDYLQVDVNDIEAPSGGYNPLNYEVNYMGYDFAIQAIMRSNNGEMQMRSLVSGEQTRPQGMITMKTPAVSDIVSITYTFYAKYDSKLTVKFGPDLDNLTDATLPEPVKVPGEGDMFTWTYTITAPAGTKHFVISNDTSFASYVKRLDVNMGGVAPAEPLNTPINLEVNEGLLTWNEVEGAVSYKVISNGQLLGEVNVNSFDLTQLEDGSYAFTVVAVGDGVNNLDSEASAALLYELGGSVTPGQVVDVSYNLENNFATYAEKWGGYAVKEVQSAALGQGLLPAAKISFDRASKQSTTVTSMPVVAACVNTADASKHFPTVYVTVEVAEGSIVEGSFDVQQWSASKKVTLAVEYLAGENWVEVASTGNEVSGSVVFTGLPAGVTQVRLAVSTTQTSNQQLGIRAVNLKVQF